MTKASLYITNFDIHLSSIDGIENLIGLIKYLLRLEHLTLRFSSAINAEIVKASLSKIINEANLEKITTLSIVSQRLKNLPPDISKLPQLEILSLSSCSYLTSLPDEIGKLTALHTIKLRDCHALSVIPIQISQFRELNTLDLLGTSISTVPTWINTLNGLETLFLDERLRTHPILQEFIKQNPRLEIISSSLLKQQEAPINIKETLSYLTTPTRYLNLLELNLLNSLLENSSSVDSLNEIKVKIQDGEIFSLIDTLNQKTFSYINKLTIQGNIESLPPDLGHLATLLTLTIEGEVCGLSGGLGQFTQLTRLTIRGKINNLPVGLGNLPKLLFLIIESNLSHLPQGLGQLPKLTTLTIKGNLNNLPQGLGQLPELFALNIEGNLLDLPVGLGNQPKLLKLTIKGDIERLPQGIRNLLKLQHLTIKEDLQDLPQRLRKSD